MAWISKKIVLLNLPLLKTVVGRKTNLLANRKNKTICSLFGLVGVALAKNSFASSSGLVNVSKKVLNIFLSPFFGCPFLLQQNKAGKLPIGLRCTLRCRLHYRII